MKKLLMTLAAAICLHAAVYAQYENTTIVKGKPAPELAFNNPEGEKLKLSEINKGRIVLLDFWASWCRPCRMASPGLVAIYEKYKDTKFKGAKKGFTVVSVSLDNNTDAWKKAIETDKLSWSYHMSDPGGWQSKPAEIYGIQYIPQAFLLGPDGKVIGKYNLAEEAAGDIEKLANDGYTKN
jgi:thiol-disulfide isomerase/thioredoxin